MFHWLCVRLIYFFFFRLLWSSFNLFQLYVIQYCYDYWEHMNIHDCERWMSVYQWEWLPTESPMRQSNVGIFAIGDWRSCCWAQISANLGDEKKTTTTSSQLWSEKWSEKEKWKRLQTSETYKFSIKSSGALCYSHKLKYCKWNWWLLRPPPPPLSLPLHSCAATITEEKAIHA